MIFNPNVMAAAGGGAVNGSYTGDGKYQRSLNLGFEPMAIFMVSSPDSGSNVFRFFAVNGAPYGIGGGGSLARVKVSFSADGISMGESNNPNCQGFNASNTVYHYIAIPQT